MKIRHPRRAFVLLEVVISLTILTITVGAVLRSFTQSLSAARQIGVKTQAAFFARQLLDEFEINPPEPGVREGGFGDDYRAYTFRAEVDLDEPDYRGVQTPREIDRMFRTRTVEIVVTYDDGRHPPFEAVRVESAIIGFEKFSYQAKRQIMAEQ